MSMTMAISTTAHVTKLVKEEMTRKMANNMKGGGNPGEKEGRMQTQQSD